MIHYSKLVLWWFDGNVSAFEVGEDDVLSIIEIGDRLVITNNNGSGSTIYLDNATQVDWWPIKEDA